MNPKETLLQKFFFRSCKKKNKNAGLINRFFCVKNHCLCTSDASMLSVSILTESGIMHTLVESNPYAAVDSGLRAAIFDGLADAGLEGADLVAAYHRALRSALPHPLADIALANMETDALLLVALDIPPEQEPPKTTLLERS